VAEAFALGSNQRCLIGRQCEAKVADISRHLPISGLGKLANVVPQIFSNIKASESTFRASIHITERLFITVPPM
jgi:hypothetical protein